MRRLVALFLLLASLGAFCRGSDDSLKVYHLRNKIRPVATEPSADYSDLLFLADELKSRDVVAAGEATHGSKEFFTLKHRLFSLLCEKNEVKIFGLEESYAAGLLVNEYIHGESQLKATEVVLKMSFMWRTREMKDLIEWMKAYNDDPLHPEKITFFGFDFHGPHHAARWLYRYFGQTDTAYLAQIKPFLKKFEDKTYPKEKISDKEQQENITSIRQIRSRLLTHKAAYEKAGGSAKWTDADHLLECLLQYTDTYRSGDVDFFKRDPYMSANIQWMYKTAQPGRKMMLWAHNEHVASAGSLPAMGKLLKEALGDKFYNIGFVFNEGEYTGTRQYKCSSLEAGVFSFSPAPAGTFSNIVSMTGVKSGFLSMDLIGLDALTANWYMGSQRVYEVGYRGFDNMKKLLLKKRKLSELYNGVFFVKKVSNTEHYLFGGTKSNAIYFDPFPPN
jgi:erythromycin esterase